MLAECSLLLDRPAEAVKLMNTATGLVRPPHALSLSLLAVAQQCAGQLADAEVTFKKASSLVAALQPHETCLFNVRRGHLELALQKVAKAVATYEAALATNGESTMAKEGLAWARHHLLDGSYEWKKERRAYIEVRKEHPSFMRARMHHAHLKWRQGCLLSAAAELEHVVSNTTVLPYYRAAAYVFRALVHCRGRRYGAALEDVDAALALQPTPYVERLARFARG